MAMMARMQIYHLIAFFIVCAVEQEKHYYPLDQHRAFQ